MAVGVGGPNKSETGATILQIFRFYFSDYHSLLELLVVHEKFICKVQGILP